MGRIIFLNCFSKDAITGGIKVTYQHAATLAAKGFETIVFQPDGAPQWLDPAYHGLVRSEMDIRAGDVTVFPETLNGWFLQAARDNTWPSLKVIFCQNQYYMFSYGFSRREYEQMGRGIRHFIVPSKRARDDLRSVLGLENIDIVPPAINRDLFYPRRKENRILVASRKWPSQAGVGGHDYMCQIMLRLKYPDLPHADWTWTTLANMTEVQTAEEMGRSRICLSLGRLESLGMIALEAMASGCLVMGYHGGGGREYVSPQNGFWHSPEDLEGLADSVAFGMTLPPDGNPFQKKMLDQGLDTASFFSRDRMEEALVRVYAGLLEEASRL